MNYYKNNIRHVKGDTFSSTVIVEGLGQELDSIYFTCRDNLNDDSNILFEKGLNRGIEIIDYDAENDIRTYSIRIEPYDTKSLQAGSYFYDVQIAVNSDVFTIMKGNFIIEQDATRKEDNTEDAVIIQIKAELDEINGEVISVDVFDKLDYLNDTKSLIKDSIELTDIEVADTDTFRSYADTLKNGLINVINNGTDVLFNNFPQTTGEGEIIDLEDTYEAKMKLVLKGNTKQDGTPTPDTPVTVQTVTGNQEIKISKRNLLRSSLDILKANNTSGTWVNNKYVYNGVTFTYNDDGSITANGTATSYINFYINRSGTNYQSTTLTGGTYYFTSHETTGIYPNLYMQYRVNNTPYNVYGTGNNKERQVTFTGNKTIEAVIIISENETLNNLTFYPMIATKSGVDYMPYQSKSYPITLGTTELCKIDTYQDKIFKSSGKNLFSSEMEYGSISNTTGEPGSATQTSIRTKYYIEVEPNIQYTVSNNNNYSNYTYEYDKDYNFIKLNSTGTAGTFTFTTQTTTKYIKVRTVASNTENDLTTKFQLEKGNATSYEPYGIDWYIEKQIGKVVLDGSESISITNSGTSNWYYNIAKPTGINNDSTPSQNNALCDFYPIANVGNNNTNQGIYILKSGSIRIRYGTEDTIANFKNWLSDNNITVYYILATPTYTKITDATLIMQLEKGATSYENTTNISSINSNVPFIINATALTKGSE